MTPTDPWTLGASAVVAMAALQVVLGRWRDLGALTLCAGAILVVLALPSPPRAVWIGTAVAALLAAVAQARGASRGVGHPSLVGMVFAVAVAVGAVVAAVPERPEARIVGATVIGIIGALATTLALRAPGARHRPVRWVGEIPIARRGEPSARKEPSAES